MAKKETFYIILIVILAAALVYLLLFKTQTEKCTSNMLNSTQLESMGKTAADVESFCTQAKTAFSCLNKVYYAYEEQNRSSNTNKKWLFLEAPENVSGMTLNGLARYVCNWK